MKRLVGALTFAVLVVSTLPYLFGYAAAGSGTKFTGIVFDTNDTAQYFAWMRSFSNDMLIANPLTAEPGARRFFNLQWWPLGLLAYKTPLGPVIVYHLLRVAGLVAFASALACFCKLVAPRHAKFAVLIAMLASGFGWALVVIKHLLNEQQVRYPLDIHVGEANTLMSAMAFPHLLVAGALLITIFIVFLRATGSRRWTSSVALVFLTLGLGFSHGYDLIPAVVIPATLAGLLSIRERRISESVIPALAIVVGAAPPGLYALLLTRLDATWKGVLSQYGNAGVYSPSPPHLVILIGLPLLLALPQLLPRNWNLDDHRQLFVRLWMVVGFFLLYIPTDFQIKMLIAYQVPVAILAARTLGQLEFATPKLLAGFDLARVRLAGAVVVIGFIVLTNIYLIAWRVTVMQRADYPYFLTEADTRALEELDEVAETGDVVLSSPRIGIFVPVYSDARPYVAHWAQSLNYFERVDQATFFFDSRTSDSKRIEFLEANGIDYVISGPAEAALSRSSAPPLLRLEAVVVGSTSLYRTSPNLAR